MKSQAEQTSEEVRARWAAAHIKASRERWPDYAPTPQFEALAAKAATPEWSDLV